MKINIKKEIRKVFRFLKLKEVAHDKYGNNGYIILSNKKYFVGLMSYDEWYLEPFYKGRTEKSGFSKGTLFENLDTIKILQLFYDNNFIEFKIK